MGSDTAFTTTETVFLPPSRVWSLLTDWTAAPLWMPGVTEMHAEGPLGQGTELEFHTDGHVRKVTVLGMEPGRSITLSTGLGDVRTDYRYDVQDDGEDSRMVLTVDVTVGDALSGLADEIRAAVREADSGQLAAFKRWAEKAP